MTNIEMTIIPRINITAVVPNMTGNPKVEPVTVATLVAAACAAFFASFFVAVFPAFWPHPVKLNFLLFDSHQDQFGTFTLTSSTFHSPSTLRSPLNTSLPFPIGFHR